MVNIGKAGLTSKKRTNFLYLARTMNQNFFVFFIGLFVFSTQALSQEDTLTLLSGRQISGKVKAIEDNIVKMDVRLHHALKPAEIERYRVFSIKYTEGKEQIIYKRDSLAGHDYTPEEMQRKIFGEQDARENHNMVMPLVVSTALGAAGGYYFGEDFVVVGVPFVSMLGSALLTPQWVRKKAVRDQKFLKDHDYKSGYKRVRKAKKAKQIVWGSIAGTVLGAVFKITKGD